jgi:hypothetical protein
MSQKIADIAQKVGLPLQEAKRWLRQMGVPMEGDHLSVDDETIENIVRLLTEAASDRVPTPPEPPKGCAGATLLERPFEHPCGRGELARFSGRLSCQGHLHGTHRRQNKEGAKAPCLTLP